VELDGTLYCWGANFHGAIGGGAPDYNLTPVALSPGGIGAVSLGYWTSCARTTSASLYCWGDNRVGQTGLGPTGLQLTPSAVASATPFRSITAGGNHTCAEGTGQMPICWGANFYGEVGVAISGRPEPLPTTAISGQAVASLATGYSHSCALLASGAACWGYGDYLGQGAVNQVYAGPVAIPGGVTWTAVATSWERTCGLAADSTAYCWGYRSTPGAVPGGMRFTSVVVGDAVSCGLQASGEADCWTDANPVAPPVRMGNGFVKLATQANGACGLDATGQAICWTAGLAPAPLPTNLRFLALVGGASGTTCGVATDGTAWCWGANDFGQVGDGTLTAQATPTQVAGGHTFTDISAGSYHTCALDAAGTAYCWGQNWSGQLGNGGSAAVTVPTLVF
jgi:alpha-tubulin suppressor-like RCC1 family protein